MSPNAILNSAGQGDIFVCSYYYTWSKRAPTVETKHEICLLHLLRPAITSVIRKCKINFKLTRLNHLGGCRTFWCLYRNLSLQADRTNWVGPRRWTQLAPNQLNSWHSRAQLLADVITLRRRTEDNEEGELNFLKVQRRLLLRLHRSTREEGRWDLFSQGGMKKKQCLPPPPHPSPFLFRSPPNQQMDTARIPPPLIRVQVHHKTN